MNNGRVAVVMLVFLLLGMARALAEDAERRYVETHGDRTQIVRYGVVRTADGFSVSSVSPQSTEIGQWVTGTGLVAWEQKDPGKKNDLDARRTGDLITITGLLAGVAVNRTVRIDGAPWYQIFGPAIGDLLRGQDRQEFWVVNPDDLAPHKMQVRKGGVENISVSGQSLSAQKVHFSPAGALAPFWGADFWYRTKDLAWVYSRLPEDGGLTVTALEAPGS